MAVKLASPTFSARSSLVRYVSEENRLKDRRPAVAAFLPDPPSASPERDYLSVNSLEIESVKAVATYYRAKWQNNQGKVALTQHNVFEYTDAARKSGLIMNYDSASGDWLFREGGKLSPAYKHHPVVGSHLALNSKSHSGVEFVRSLTEYAADKFARRMATKRYHSV